MAWRIMMFIRLVPPPFKVFPDVITFKKMEIKIPKKEWSSMESLKIRVTFNIIYFGSVLTI